MNEILLILPNLPKDRKKRNIIMLLITGFIGLASEGMSSSLRNGRHKALHKTVVAVESKVNLQQNKLIHSDNSIVMCYVYNVKTRKIDQYSTSNT